MTAGRSKNKLAVRDMRISRGANGNFLLQCVLTPKPIEIREGTTIDYQLRLRGVPIR